MVLLSIERPCSYGSFLVFGSLIAVTITFTIPMSRVWTALIFNTSDALRLWKNQSLSDISTSDHWILQVYGFSPGSSKKNLISKIKVILKNKILVPTLLYFISPSCPICRSLTNTQYLYYISCSPDYCPVPTDNIMNQSTVKLTIHIR